MIPIIFRLLTLNSFRLGKLKHRCSVQTETCCMGTSRFSLHMVRSGHPTSRVLRMEAQYYTPRLYPYLTYSSYIDVLIAEVVRSPHTNPSDFRVCTLHPTSEFTRIRSTVYVIYQKWDNHPIFFNSAKFCNRLGVCMPYPLLHFATFDLCRLYSQLAGPNAFLFVIDDSMCVLAPRRSRNPVVDQRFVHTHYSFKL